jgi:DNA-binding transcriptional regulator YiaG
LDTVCLLPGQPQVSNEVCNVYSAFFRTLLDLTGTALRQLRTRLGCTQRELAARVGVTANTVARWERDEVRITEPMERLLRLVAGAVPTTPAKGRRRR